MSSSAAAQGRRVRQRLLAAAAELIPERGWTAVSTRVLAARAGVAASVVHYHFPSLSALLNEAAVALMRQVAAELDSALETAQSPDDAVEAMVASLDRYTGADPMSLLAIEAYLAATRDELLRDQIGAVVEGLRQRLGRWLGERDVPAPDETAAVLVAAVDGLLLQRGLGSDAEVAPVAAVMRRLVGTDTNQERAG